MPRLAPILPVLQDERSSKFTSSSLSSNFLNDAIIGSLPKGLTSEEKMKVLQSTPMSPSRALLQEMSNTAVSQRVCSIISNSLA